MNILILSHLYPRPHDPSFGIFVHRQVKHLQGLGHHVTALSPIPWSPKVLHFSAKWRDYGLAPERVTWEGVEVYYTRYLRLPGAWFRALAGFTVYKSILSLALKLHNACEFDIIHSNFLLPDGLAGMYLGRKLDLPTVCTVHGSDGLIHPHESPLTLYYSKIVIQRTDQIVAVSQALKNALEYLGKPSTPFRVVYNGVDINEFQGTGASPDNVPPQLASSKPYILFVGRQIYVKGLKDLLIAFAELADTIKHNLVIVGPTLSEVKKLAPELVSLLGGRLTIPGTLSPDQIPIYMQHCDMLVLPSYSEGFGMVLLEAMACGKPIIASNVTGIPEAVADGVTGLLVPPQEPLVLKDAIQSLVTDSDRRKRMGTRGRERVLKVFTSENNASEIVSIYQETIQGHLPKYVDFVKRRDTRQ